MFLCRKYGFTGDIEDIQLWKGALTPEQIKASRAGYTQAPEDLLYYYKFNSADVDITQFPNKGTGGECVAELAYGTVKWTQDPDFGYAVEMYVYTPQVPEYVQGHVKAQHIVTYTGTSEGGSFVVKNGDAIVESGSSVEEGTWLTVEATPDVNYQVKAIKVNGVAIDGSGFTLSEASEITVEFMNEQVYTVTYPSELTGGKLKVTQDSDGEEIPSGTELQKNTAITIVPEAELGYEIGSFTVNGVDRLTELSENGGEYWITIAEDVELTVTFTPLTGISGAKLTEVYFDRTTSILHAPEGAMWRVYNITGSAVFEGQGTQNLQNLSVGTYIAKVKTDNGIRTIKFIKK